MSYIVSARNVTKVFKGKEVVSDVSMNISEGQIYGFLGPNGAGKTTFMRMLLNLVKPTNGEIELFGEKQTPSSIEVFKRIGSIIEYPVFYENLTAKENLELHCEYMGFYNKKAISDVMELVKLTAVNGKAVGEFSLGMKQRLGIARALVTKPELLILDEPINGLDPAGIKDFRDLFQMLSKEHRMTLFISSHLLSEVEMIADTIGIIQNGVFKEEVSMNELKHRHSDFIEIVTPHCRKAVFILEKSLKINNFKVIGDHTIRIYEAGISQPEVSKTLIMNDVAIESIHHKRTSLEEYFIDQTGGGEKYA